MKLFFLLEKQTKKETKKQHKRECYDFDIK